MNNLVVIFVFAGAMAALGCAMRIIFFVLNRRMPAVKASSLATIEEMSQRLARMEQAIEATAVEVERISEAQRFATKLLVEKSNNGPAESSRSRVTTPH